MTNTGPIPSGRGALLATLLVTGAGCAARGSATPAPPPLVVESPATSSPVQLQCERLPSGIVQIRLRNTTDRTRPVELRFFAYAGRATGFSSNSSQTPEGFWEHWWTQPTFQLAPRQSWTARLYEMRTEKIEARDPRGRLLARADLRKMQATGSRWGTTVAVDANGTWRPFGAGRARSWQVFPPAALWNEVDSRPALPVKIIADARAETFRPEQLAALRRMVERGRTLILCGGADLDRLRGWQRAGLLPLPVRGTRRLPGLSEVAQRYEAPPVAGPLAIADVGPIAFPARVLLAEQGVPLIVAAHRGLGTVLFVTFDPTRPPVRGARLETAFWREWEVWSDEGVARLAVVSGPTSAYRRVRRELGMEPPSIGLVAALSLLYLLVLGLILARARRRLRALLGVVAAGCAVALVIGPLLRGVTPAAGFAGDLALRSGDARGRWRGGSEIIQPDGSITTFRLADGYLSMWRQAPLLQRLPSPYRTIQTTMRRWLPVVAEISTLTRLDGPVILDVSIEGDQVIADVRNETPHVLEEAAVLWGRTTLLRLGDLPPGARVRRRMARVSRDGRLLAPPGAAPAGYGDLHGHSDTPLNHPDPILLAICRNAPLPRLLIEERPVRSAGHTVMMVAAPGVRLRDPAVLPRDALAPRVLHVSGRGDGWRPIVKDSGEIRVEPDERALIEFRLPVGSARIPWRSARFAVYGDLIWRGSLDGFDWSTGKWTRLATVHRQGAFALRSPARFIHPVTETIRVRLRSEALQASWARVAVTAIGR